MGKITHVLCCIYPKYSFFFFFTSGRERDSETMLYSLTLTSTSFPPTVPIMISCSDSLPRSTGHQRHFTPNVASVPKPGGQKSEKWGNVNGLTSVPGQLPPCRQNYVESAVIVGQHRHR